MKATIDHDAFTVTRSVHIAAPRELVWAALTDPSQLGQWFGERVDFPDGIAEGATGTLGWPGEEDVPARIERCVPTTHFDFTWGSPGEPLREGTSTLVRFVLVDDAAATTTVTVTETGFGTLDDTARRRTAMEENAHGWTVELDDLAAYASGLLSRMTPRADVEGRPS